MTEAFLEELTGRYRAYVGTFRDAAGALPPMVRVKLDHTMKVVDAARRIMEGEAFPPRERPEGEACALLHDAGRYAQFTEFGTFRDACSVDHAEKGVEVIVREGWLDALPAGERARILDTVRFHNKRALPDDLPPETRKPAFLVRDADKLDIFRVMEDAVRDGALETRPELSWGLPLRAGFSPRVAEAVCAGESVRYEWIQSVADFVLVQVGWLNGGLHFPTSRRMARDRGTLEFRRALLKRLTGDDAGVDRICDLVREKGRD